MCNILIRDTLCGLQSVMHMLCCAVTVTYILANPVTLLRLAFLGKGVSSHVTDWPVLPADLPVNTFAFIRTRQRS